MTLQTFNRSATGRLESILDTDGNTVTVQYAAGEIRFVAPFGETTIVTLDADGLASRVAYLNDPNPAAFTELQYDPLRRGLISTLIDRRGQHHVIALNSLGQLDSDALSEMGSGWSLSQVEILDGGPSSGGRRITDVTSNLGRLRTFESAELRDGRHQRSYTAPDGSQSVYTEQQVGERTRQLESSDQTSADGMTVHVDYGPDPKDGWRVPFAEQATVTMPSGSIMTLRSEREIARFASVRQVAADGCAHPRMAR